MKYYQEIELFDDGEVSIAFIWRKIFEELHRMFVRFKDRENLIPFGLSFPDIGQDRFPLGRRVRIFAMEREMLDQLGLENSLRENGDYAEVHHILPVPTTESHAVFRRVQFKKTNPERLARRYAKRHNVTYEEALSRYIQMDVEAVIKENKLPFVHFKSASTDQFVKLFIEKQIHATPSEGLFGTFGLSSTTTVPCF